MRRVLIGLLFLTGLAMGKPWPGPAPGYLDQISQEPRDPSEVQKCLAARRAWAAQGGRYASELVPRLSSTSAQERYEAALLLGGAGVIAPLRERLAEESDGRVRDALHAALACAGDHVPEHLCALLAEDMKAWAEARRGSGDKSRDPRLYRYIDLVTAVHRPEALPVLDLLRTDETISEASGSARAYLKLDPGKVAGGLPLPRLTTLISPPYRGEPVRLELRDGQFVQGDRRGTYRTDGNAVVFAGVRYEVWPATAQVLFRRGFDEADDVARQTGEKPADLVQRYGTLDCPYLVRLSDDDDTWPVVFKPVP